MSIISPHKQPQPTTSPDTAKSTAEANSASAAPSSPSKTAGSRPRRPTLSLPGFGPKASPATATPAAQRAITAPNTPNVSTLQAPTQAVRAKSVSEAPKTTPPSPAVPFASMLGASAASAENVSHLATAKALAIVIEAGEQGLKTVFGYDDKGHIAFGSHDELEMTKTKSTQHQNLLQRMGMSLKGDTALEADTRKFGGDLVRSAIIKSSSALKGVYVGGTRLKAQDDGSLQFTISEGLGFQNVTPEVLEPVAQFHANVLRLSGLADKTIKGDGQAMDALAKRVSELLA